jgi:site-specific recombinase XerC
MPHTALLRDVFDDFLDDKRYQGLSPATLATSDRSLRVTLNWFDRRGYVKESPMRDLPKRRTPRSIVPTFSREDVEAILVVAREGRYPTRDVALPRHRPELRPWRP